MAEYQVLFRPSVDRQLRKLPVEVQRRVVRGVAALAFDPRPSGVVKLSGEENLWRIRIGDYRIVYEIHDDRLIVLVLRVVHRKEVYREK
jgi:mRNA interferase RelE/StbE